MSRRLLKITSIFLLTAFFYSAVLCHGEEAGESFFGENKNIEIFDGDAELFLVRDWELYYYDADNAALLAPFEYDYLMIDLYRYYPGYIGDIENINLYLDEDRFLEKYRDYYDDVLLQDGPFYDSYNNTLSWRFDYSAGDFEYFQYECYFFTREGYINVRLVCSLDPEYLPLVSYLSGAIEISPGNRYDDFDLSTDSYCGYDAVSYMLYWDLDDSWQERGNSVYEFSREFTSRALSNSSVILFLIAAVIALSRSKNFRNMKKPGAAKRKSRDKTPFRVRKAHDNDLASYKPGDGTAYYQKLRRAEERDAYKYADRYDR